MAVGPLTNAEAWQDPRVEEMRGRIFGPRLGFVRDVQDPLKIGRVRIYIPSVFGDQDGDQTWTDWCLPESKSLDVPPVNSTVMVEFEMGIVTHPHYRPGWHTGGGADSSVPKAGKEVLDETWLKKSKFTAAGRGPKCEAELPADTARANLPKYPFNKVYETESGHTFELDDSPGLPRARYRHPKGTTILVDSDGSVHIQSAGAQYFRPGGDFVIALTQGATFKCVYHNGTGFSCGANGFHVTGHSATIMNRVVQHDQKTI